MPFLLAYSALACYWPLLWLMIYFPCNRPGEIIIRRRAKFPLITGCYVPLCVCSWNKSRPNYLLAIDHKHNGVTQTQSRKHVFVLKTTRLKFLFGVLSPVFSPGSLPLRRRMDDEEEDMSRPISQPWGTPFRDVKDCATQIAAGQALAAVAAAVPTSQSHNNNNNSIGINNTLPCTLYGQPRVPFHSKERESLSVCHWMVQGDLTD